MNIRNGGKIFNGALRVVNLETEFQKYNEKQYVRQEVERLFSDMACQEQLEQIVELMQCESGQNRAIYLQALKQFGRKDGLEIYRRVKQWRMEQEQEMKRWCW